MAFGLRRWLIAALASSALVAVAFLPPEGERTPRLLLYRYDDHEDHLRDVLRRYGLQLRLLELRDSILEVAAAMPAGQEPLLLIQEWFPQAVQDAIRAFAQEPFDALRNRGPRHRIVVAVAARDGVGPFMWARTYGWLYYYLPSATDGETCLVTLALGRADPEEKWLRSIGSLAERQVMLGPCAYYAAFGPPGSYIEQWLESTDFFATMSPAWTLDSQPLGPIEPERRRYSRYYEPALYGCAAGNRRACRLILLARERVWLYPFVQRQPGIVRPRDYRYYALYFPHSERLLSDLLTEMGVERFLRFWSSEADVDAAFAHAFGVELEDWMMSWSGVQLGRVERPAPGVSSAVLGLLLAAVFVGGATFYVRGRQVS
ncbi:MAG: hypothetical protein PVJ64_12690 [Gemmatimonadales bacterium]|jgi:hypothetical protein